MRQSAKPYSNTKLIVELVIFILVFALNTALILPLLLLYAVSP